MNKKTSLKDIASQLGVSTALVSYVINNKEKEARVSVEMAEKIRKVAAELNYRPNLIAKSLKSGRTNTIGLIVADISNPFFSSIAKIIEHEARLYGYAVIFGSSNEEADKLKSLIEVFQNRQVDAFIIVPAEHTEKLIKDLQKSNMPVVLIDRYFLNVDVDSVRINNSQAAYNAVEHLIKNGRNKIAMMAYDTSLLHMQERISGYKKALKENGIKLNPVWLRRASYKNIAKDVAAEIEGLLSPTLQVDAFFFATNSLAVEALKIINRLGIKVPDDLAIISFDESDAFDFFHSPVTFVSQSVEDIGKAAVTLVRERIEDNKRKHNQVVIEAKLIVRDSSRRAEAKEA